MGKIVKYCNSCDEGFAEKFGFCPNCGQGLEAFEMNPLQAAEAAPVPETPAFIEPVQETVQAAPEAAEQPTIEASAAETEVFTAPEPEPAEVEEPEVEEPEVETVIKPAPVFVQTTPVYADAVPASLEAEHDKAMAEGGYYLTVIEEKNVKQRNTLLLGTFGLMICAVIFGLAYSIFSRDLEVGAINDDVFNAILVDDIPMTVEEQVKQMKDKEAGGGGGGGREDQEETTRGDLANQSEHPTRQPDARVYQTDNPNFLKLETPTTQGTNTYQKQYYKWGDPNGRFDSFSNGTGSGGGQGSGYGTGQGSGRGTGNGSGNGSGSGGGLGNGNGNGTGNGVDGNDGPPPPRGVSSPLKILFKPKARYTDAARVSNIQGSVTLRVTFLASGQIGSVSTVRGLGGGLTEEAISAARGIRFEPAKVNGVPQTTVRTMEISFAIY